MQEERRTDWEKPRRCESLGRVLVLCEHCGKTTGGDFAEGRFKEERRLLTSVWRESGSEEAPEGRRGSRLTWDPERREHAHRWKGTVSSSRNLHTEINSPRAIHHSTIASSSAHTSPYSLPVLAIPDTIVTKPIGIVPRNSECVSLLSIAKKKAG